jgi:hypothetical protein
MSNRLANVTAMKPNEEFYPMGRVEAAPKPAKPAA